MRPTQALQGGGAPNPKIGQYVALLLPGQMEIVPLDLRLFHGMRKSSSMGMMRRLRDDVGVLMMMLTCCLFWIGGSVTGAISVSLLQFSIDYNGRHMQETERNRVMAHEGPQQLEGSTRDKRRQLEQ